MTMKRSNNNMNGISSNTDEEFTHVKDDDHDEDIDVSGYSSDSSIDDYYLNGDKEHKIRTGLQYFMELDHELNGSVDPNCDPDHIAKFLKEMNDRVTGLDITVDMEDIKKKTTKAARRRERVKKRLIKLGLFPDPNKTVDSKNKFGSDGPIQDPADHGDKNKPSSSSTTSMLMNNGSPHKITKRDLFPSPTKLWLINSLDHLPISNPNQESLKNTNYTETDTTQTSNPSNISRGDSSEGLAANIGGGDAVAGGGGDEEEQVVMVFEKKLTKTDVEDGQCRFLMPRRQVNKDLLLTEEEVNWLMESCKTKEVPATLTDFLGNSYRIKVMMNLVGRSSYCYKITKPWNQIKENAKLCEGTTVQLWASRPAAAGSLINFILKKVDIYE